MKIAIVGTHYATKSLAPYKHADWHIWACSPRNMGELPRHDAWFELHQPQILARRPEYQAWCYTQPRIYLPEALPEAPGSVTYPREEMVAEFGPYFFTSSLSWMLALAISMKPETMGIYGVETSTAEEYAYQRPSHHHFIQVARDRGIEVIAAPSSSILRPPKFYGFELYPPNGSNEIPGY